MTNPQDPQNPWQPGGEQPGQWGDAGAQPSAPQHGTPQYGGTQPSGVQSGDQQHSSQYGPAGQYTHQQYGPAGQYTQQQYGGPGGPYTPSSAVTGAPAPRKNGKGKILTGIALLLLSLLAGVGGMVWAVSSSKDLLKDAKAVTPGQTVHLDAGKSMTMWAETTGGDESYSGTCRVEGPAQPSVKSVTGSHTLSYNEKTWTRAVEVTVPESGDYTMECSGANKVKLTTTEDASGAGKALGLGIGSFVLGALLGVPGLILLILGLVQRGRSKRNAAAAPAPGAISYGG